MLCYRLPREPSTPRASVWRRLRRLGVAQLADGLVALPEDARTREQLEWIADEVLGAGGTASLWLAQPTSLADERQVATGLTHKRATEYAELTARARAAQHTPPAEQRRALRSLRGELRQIRRRDYFAAPGRDNAAAAVDELAASIAAGSAADAGAGR